MESKVMEKEVTASIPEGFIKANDEFEHALFIMENLFTTLKCAALWREQNPSLEGPSWGAVLDSTVRDQINSFMVRTSDLQKAAIVSVRQNSFNAAFHSSRISDEVSKLHTFLSLIEVVGEDEDRGEHRAKVNWSEIFEIFGDMLSNVAGASAILWNNVTGEEKDISMLVKEGTVEQ
jgi:hypothetical protein